MFHARYLLAASLALSPSLPAFAKNDCAIKLEGTAMTRDGKTVLAFHPEAQEIFASLGFKKSALNKAESFLNYCATEKPAASEVYGKQGFSRLLAVQTPCERKFAEALGLTPQVIDNFGSMDSGGEMPVGFLLACSDGIRTVPCLGGMVKASPSLSELCPAKFREEATR